MDILKEIAKKHQVDLLSVDSQFWMFAISLILKVQKDGASFFIKSDGERASNIFTVMIEGGCLGDEYFRCETDNLEEGISKVISDYSRRFWD